MPTQKKTPSTLDSLNLTGLSEKFKQSKLAVTEASVARVAAPPDGLGPLKNLIGNWAGPW